MLFADLADIAPDDWRQIEAALEGAAALLRASRFTRGALARDASGAEVDPAAPEATAFCIQGAFLRAGSCLDARLVRVGAALLRQAAGQVTGRPVADLFALNDAMQTDRQVALAVIEQARVLAASRYGETTAPVLPAMTAS